MGASHKIDRLFLDIDAIFGTEEPNGPTYGRDWMHVELHRRASLLDTQPCILTRSRGLDRSQTDLSFYRFGKANVSPYFFRIASR